MRRTAKYTLFIGFGFSSLATFIIMQYGTGFTVMTTVLYLYGFVCLLGGVIGYRKASLEHATSHDEPGLRHVFGLHRFKELFASEKWGVEMEGEEFEAETVAIQEDVVSVEREWQGDTVGISYPREMLVSLARGS